MPTRRLLLAVLAICLVAGAPPAAAFRACTPWPAVRDSGGHWPDPRNSSRAGTGKWQFDWRVDREGIEVSNVRYNSKLVLSRASLPFLPVHYPEFTTNPPFPPDCPGTPPGGPHGFNDTLPGYDLDTVNPFCCSEVPITVCNLADRQQACFPLSGTVGNCPKRAIGCGGVCVGTQIDSTLPLEDGKGEVASKSSNADILLSAIFKLGGYQFVQRWRFQDNGTILPSLRAGGVHDCQWHNHQIYWRFHFQLADGVTPAAKVQQCDSSLGACPDTDSPAWSTITSATCGNRSSSSTRSWWRISDTNLSASGRAVIVQTNPSEETSAFCENTTSECGTGGCINGRDFCALGAAEPHETLVTDNCNDHLPDASPGGLSDVAFWYFAHVNHHDPCNYLPMCDPAFGTVAFGPTIRLVGSW